MHMTRFLIALADKRVNADLVVLDVAPSGR
jgi:hypothetical protein